MSAPRNREIGFVSSSFSFRACRACRACGRGEAAWAHTDRYPYRWAFRVRVSGCVPCLRASFRLVFVHRRMGFNTFFCFPCPFACFLLTGAWVLRFVIAKTLYCIWLLRFVIANILYFTMVFKAWPHKPLYFTHRRMGFKVCDCKNVVFYMGFKVCHCKNVVFDSGF